MANSPDVDGRYFLPAIAPIRRSREIYCHGRTPRLRHPSPRATKSPEWAGITTHACSLH